MNAMRMIVQLIRCNLLMYCFVTMHACTLVNAAESFYVFAADMKNQQVLSIAVQTTSESVSIRQGKSLALAFGPASTAAHPNGKHLIVTSAARGKAIVATIEILDDGELRLLESSSLKQPSGYTSFDRSGRFFMTANYGKGTIAVYRIGDKARVGEQVCALKTPRTEAHCVLTTRDNRFAYVPCVKNNNALYQFAFDERTGQLRPLEPFNASPPAMFGPRHVAYHPTLPIAYFSNEQQLGVSVYEIAIDGQLVARQHAVTMPRRSPFKLGKRDLHASDLVISPDGTRLFVAVRDFNGDEDSVFTFQVAVDGKLSKINRTRVGDIPWKLDLSPDGNYLLVSESFDRRLSILKIHADDSLTSAGHVDWDAEVRDMVVVQAQ